MNMQRLLANYPGTVYQRMPFFPHRDTFYFYQKPYYVAIPVDKLTDQERALIETLFMEEMPPHFSQNAKYWYDLFMKGEGQLTFPEDSREIRIIYFHLRTPLERTEYITWYEVLKGFFRAETAFVFLSMQQGFIVEDGKRISIEELDAIANTLENDFSVKCKFLIGLQHQVSPQMRQIFHEELHLLDQMIANDYGENVTSVDTELVTRLKPSLNQCLVLEDVRRIIKEDECWVAIIHAIWVYQGNISLAAKHLYMHRNTLQYRIDKFDETTGISLRKMDGLAIAYISSL